MDPCFIRCIECENSVEELKKLKCTKGFFDVKITDGILLTPLDFDCIEFIKKEEEVYDREEN